MTILFKPKTYNNISQEGFLNSFKESDLRNIELIYSKNFIAFFQQMYKDSFQYRVNICFSAPKLTVIKTLILKGNTLGIKRFMYHYMLMYEDIRIRGGT